MLILNAGLQPGLKKFQIIKDQKGTVQKNQSMPVPKINKCYCIALFLKVIYNFCSTVYIQH